MVIPKCSYKPAKFDKFLDLSDIIKALEKYYSDWENFSRLGKMQKLFVNGFRLGDFKNNLTAVNKKYSAKPYDYSTVKQCAALLYNNSSRNCGLNTLAATILRAYLPALNLHGDLVKLAKAKHLASYAKVEDYILSDAFKKDESDLHEKFLGAQNEQLEIWKLAAKNSLSKEFFDILEPYCTLGKHVGEAVNKDVLPSLISDVNKIKNGKISKVILMARSKLGKLKK